MPNPTRGLTFLPPGAALMLAIMTLIMIGGLCWLSWSRHGYRRGHGILELIRFTLSGLVVFTLLQPEWSTVRSNPKSPRLVVLWDESNSMQTVDVVEPNSAGPMARLASIQSLLDESAWHPGDVSAQANWNVEFQSFSSTESQYPQDATDINSSLENILERRHETLAGVVLITDGDWNTGGTPARAAARYRIKQIPIFPVVVGSPVPLPDLEVLSLDAPTFGVAGKPTRIPFRIANELGQSRELQVTLSVDGHSAVSEPFHVDAMSELQDALVLPPLEAGDYKLELSIPVDHQESQTNNNSLTTKLTIRDEQLQVLVIESYPRWEYRYLRNALERDPGIDVHCLLFHPELDGHGEGRGYLEHFPTVGELSAYDVVFLGDVGVGGDQLTSEQTTELRDLVSSQAAGLVLLPGRYGHQHSLLPTELADLFPVELAPSQPTGTGTRRPGHFALTRQGRRSLLTKLADEPQQNSDIWRALPGFHWYATIDKTKPGSEILAVHDHRTNAFGRAPLIVTKTFGTGKVLFMATDGAWRWREGVEDKFHYRFWGQVARWMAYQRQMAEGQQIRLFYSPDRPQVGDVVTLNANALDRSGGPLTDGTLIVQVVAPHGGKQTLRLQPGSEESSGLFTGQLRTDQPGTYQLAVRCLETGAELKTDLTVQGSALERIGGPARRQTLEEVAKIANGAVFTVPTASEIVQRIAQLPPPAPTVHRTRLWAHPAWGGFLVTLMALFWIGRKIVGAI